MNQNPGFAPPQFQQMPAPKVKKPFYKKVWVWGVAGVVALTFAVNGAKSSEPAEAIAEAPAASAPAAAAPAAGAPAAAAPAAGAPAAAAPAADAPAGLNTPVKAGDFTFTVTSVKDGPSQVGGEYLNQKAQGKYVVVTLSVKNDGNKAEYFLDNDVKLLNAQGQEYSNDSTAAIYAASESRTDSVWIKEINPGMSVGGDLYFDVPVDFVADKVQLKGPGFLDDKVHVSAK